VKRGEVARHAMKFMQEIRKSISDVRCPTERLTGCYPLNLPKLKRGVIVMWGAISQSPTTGKIRLSMKKKEMRNRQKARSRSQNFYILQEL
jgi:hypothetical protein